MEPQKVLHLHKTLNLKKPKLLGDYMVTEKKDGWYCYANYVPGVGWGYLHSKCMRKIPAFENYREQLDKLPKFNHKARLILEATIPGLNFHTTNGIFNRSVGEYHCNNVVFFPHDIIDLENLHIPAYERWKHLKELDFSSRLPYTIQDLPLLDISDKQEVWMAHAEAIWDKDGEGVCLKYVNGVYSPGARDSSLMKIKLEKTLFYVCTGYYWTTGEKGHPNLNITCKGKDNVVIDVRVGKHTDINMLVDNPDSFLDKIVEIKCMCKLPDGKLREPRFVKVTNKTLKEIS